MKCLGMSAFVSSDRSESSVETSKTYSVIAKSDPSGVALQKYFLM